MTPEKQDSSQRVIEAVRELSNSVGHATREALQIALSDMRMGAIDDRLKVLTDDGLLVRIRKGRYRAPDPAPESRIVSATILPDRLLKIEFGDHMLTLTQQEARDIAALLTGHCLMIAQAAIAGSLPQVAPSLPAPSACTCHQAPRRRHATASQ